MNTKKQNSSAISKSNFTLIELLVVIVIIAVLASMIFVGSKKFREMGNNSTCQSNLSQLGKFYNDYQLNNEWTYPELSWDGGSPKAQGSGDEDGPYLPTSFFPSLVCPSDESPELRDYVDKNGKVQSNISSSYGYNLEISGALSTRLPNLSSILLAFDAKELAPYDNSVEYRHANTANHLFLDGSIVVSDPDEKAAMSKNHIDPRLILEEERKNL